MKSGRGLTRRSSMMTLISSMVRSKARRSSGRPRLARLDVGGARNQIVECDEDRLAPLVHVDHRIEQSIDDEMRAVIRHAVERGPVRLDPVQHAVDDPGDALLQLLDPSRRERRHQQAANAGMLLAVHLGDELRIHDLVELLPARTARHLRGEGLACRRTPGARRRSGRPRPAAGRGRARRTAAAAPIRPCAGARSP